MAWVSHQSSRSSGASQNYAKKEYVAISAINATVPRFEQRLQELREAYGKGGFRPKQARDENGKLTKDENGQPVAARGKDGEILYESRFVQSHNLVQSFAHEELNPDDPESWEKAQELGRALAEERAPGHPVLIATEINGRSGCVHNHIIIGNVHPETGKLLDTNRFWSAPMVVGQQRVFEAKGFEQREDARRVAEAVEAEMAARRQQVIDDAPKGISATALKRKIVTAERTVNPKRFVEKQLTVAEREQDRKIREYGRYQLQEQTREALVSVGAVPPPQRFSEMELAARAKDAITDIRSQNWEKLDEIGREHYGVTVSRRGKNISYGMMLADENGELREPSKAHVRRGSRLGEGFQVEEVEAQMLRNVELEKERAAQQQAQAVQLQHQQSNDELKALLEKQQAASIKRAHSLDSQKFKDQLDRLEQGRPAKEEIPSPEPVEVEEPRTEETQQEDVTTEGTTSFKDKMAQLRRERERRSEPQSPVQNELPQQQAAPQPEQTVEVRRERPVGILRANQRSSVELIAVMDAEKSNAVDFQLSATDPAAKNQAGLHLMAREGKARRAVLSAEHLQMLEKAAGENRIAVNGQQVLAVRGDLYSTRDGRSYVPDMQSMKPSDQKIHADVLEKQREAEDLARSTEKDRRKEQFKALDRSVDPVEQDRGMSL